jgi:hypothetical protein
MRLQQTLAAIGIAAAAATALPAGAQSTASATVGNLNIQLIDLAPGDGIAPSLTFTGTSNTFANAILYSDTTFTNIALEDSSVGTDNSPAHASNGSGNADAFASTLSVSATTNMFSNSGWTLAQGTMDFILSPNTRAIFTVIASVSALPDFTEGGLGAAFGSALLYGEVTNDASSGVTSFSSNMISSLFNEQRTLSAVIDSQGVEASGWIGMQAMAESMSLAPVSSVPEPATVGMLAAGLGVLSGAARRRKGKAA